MQVARSAVVSLASLRVVGVAIASLALTACFDSSSDSGSGGSSATSATSTQAGAIPVSSPGVSAVNSAPSVGGVPAAAIPAGFPYVFKPTVSDPDGDVVTFSIVGLPTWAEFNPRTGELRGTPTIADLGETGGIVITATDGKASTSFGPFRVLINRPATSATTGGTSAPTISGNPTLTVVAGTGYTLAVTASDADGDRLTFGATNLPAWLGLNTANGMVTGTPTLAQVGTYANISISVTDGTSTVALPAFTIVVTAPAGASPAPTVGSGTATISWVKPTQNSDGTSLTDLAGFVVKYGNSPTSLTQRIAVNDPAMTRYTLQNLGAGTWYFTVVAETFSSNESDAAQVVSKTIS